MSNDILYTVKEVSEIIHTNNQVVTPCVCHPFVTQNLWKDKKLQITVKKNKYRAIG